MLASERPNCKHGILVTMLSRCNLRSIDVFHYTLRAVLSLVLLVIASSCCKRQPRAVTRQSARRQPRYKRPSASQTRCMKVRKHRCPTSSFDRPLVTRHKTVMETTSPCNAAVSPPYEQSCASTTRRVRMWSVFSIELTMIYQAAAEC